MLIKAEEWDGRWGSEVSSNSICVDLESAVKELDIGRQGSGYIYTYVCVYIYTYIICLGP